eukprot:15475943-Heterocapsa_arctica.AAC.1
MHDLIIIAGDFNLVTEEEGRISVKDGSTTCGDGIHEGIFNQELPFLAELAQSSPTRRETRDGEVFAASRLDRYYTNASAIDVEDMNAKVCVVGNVMKGNRASDHTPVTLSLECPRMEATPSKAIPRWIARHP